MQSGGFVTGQSMHSGVAVDPGKQEEAEMYPVMTDFPGAGSVRLRSHPTAAGADYS